MDFRRLTDDDLPLMHEWLNEPGVVAWWEGEDVSWDAVVAEYGAPTSAPVEHWIAVADGQDVGWIQCYAIAELFEHEGYDADDLAEARHWLELGIPNSAAGIDYLIGAPEARGRGLGSQMIESFVEQIVFGQHPTWDPCCASPYEANEPSWKALAAAGFEHHGTFDDDEGQCRLMARWR
ncbi:GNAT family N-acetyltransferase [Euzebya tangerina]|uniref:GNAT family N-acetyltransferase n=1 Tax=Euzebya tangerina TaxID=591198 RepID=UPI0013C2F1AC|nr:GNAT family N-acetyltransferase [Euzebya tangerina]